MSKSNLVEFIPTDYHFCDYYNFNLPVFDTTFHIDEQIEIIYFGRWLIKLSVQDCLDYTTNTESKDFSHVWKHHTKTSPIILILPINNLVQRTAVS